MVSDRVVHIVDADSAAMAHSAKVLMAAGYRVLTHASGAHFLAAPPDARLGCILLDIQMPEPDGLDVQDQLLKSGLGMPVIVFTGENAVDIAVRAMRAGALHFLEKPYRDMDLLTMVADAIERLEVAEDSAERKARAIRLLAALSPRELQVMDAMIAGSPNKLIAHALGLSIRTVEMYRNNLMDKLRARNLSGVFRVWLDATQSGMEDNPV